LASTPWSAASSISEPRRIVQSPSYVSVSPSNQVVQCGSSRPCTRITQTLTLVTPCSALIGGHTTCLVCKKRQCGDESEARTWLVVPPPPWT
jgi:hypothetical protein